MRELVEMLYEFDRPFIMDSSQAQTTFGLKPTPWDIVIGLFTNEGVGAWARRGGVWGRGPPMMGVLTLPSRKTSTCLTLPCSLALM
jgi:hypothetical protein